MAATVVLSVQDQFSAPLDSYAAKTQTAAEATEQFAQKMEQVDTAASEFAGEETSGGGLGGVNLSLSDFYYGIGLVRQGLDAATGAVKTFYGATIGQAEELSGTVRRLGLDIGATSDDASKLVYAANVTGVSVDSLTHGLDAAIRSLKSSKSEGIEPNIEGLATLADRYTAIQDPVLRTKFLMDNFGRSGADLAPLMQLGADGIKALGDQAEITGNVLDQQQQDTLHNYDVRVNQLTTDAKGLGVALGAELAPAATQVAQGGLNWVHTLDLIVKGQHDGSLSTTQAIADFIDLTNVLKPLKDTYAELAPTMQLVTDQNIQVSDASDRAARAQTDLANSTGAVETAYNDAASITLLYAHNTSLLTDEQQKAKDAADKLALAEMDHATMVGVSGVVTRNEQTYQQVLSGNAQKIAELRAEIQKYTDLEGQNVTVVTQGKYSAEQLAVAQERLVIAEERLAEGHYKTQASLDAATLAVRTAQDAVDKMSASQATAETTSADYSSKIADDQKALDKLTTANANAEAAMQKANKQFVIQEAQAGLTGKALYDFELRMGEIDQPTYDAITAIDKAKDEFAKTGDLSAYESAIGLIVDKLNGVPPAVDKIPDVLAPATQAFKDMQQAAHDAAIHGLQEVHDKLDALHDKTVNVNVVYHYTGGTPVNGT